MRTSSFLSACVALGVLGVAGCGATGHGTQSVNGASVTRSADATQRSSHSTASSSATAREQPRPAPVRVSNTSYGRVLVDHRGFALYLFTHDRSGASTCHGACAAAWPPYIVSTSVPRAGRGADSGLLGTVRRGDGRLQVTYRGQPLYYYTGDRRPGQILCQAVTEFGGTWYVLGPNGRAIR